MPTTPGAVPSQRLHTWANSAAESSTLAIARGGRPGVYRELEAEAFACRVGAWAPTPAGRELRLARPL